MSAGSLAAVITAAAGLVSALGVLVAQVRHANGPAHKTPLPPVATPGPARPRSGQGGSGPVPLP